MTAVVTDNRAAALEWVERNGFPTRKHEDWRYLTVSDIAQAVPGAAIVAAGPGQPAPSLDGRVPDLGGPRLVFVNGHLVESSNVDIPGVVVTGVAAALESDRVRVESLLALDAEPLDAFAALNVALAVDGAFVELAAGTVVESPIHLVFVTDGADGSLLSNPRSVVVAGAGSRATIVETHLGGTSTTTTNNTVLRMVLAEGATVEHVVTQSLPESAVHLSVLDAELDAASQLTSSAFTVGGTIARHEARVRLVGAEAGVVLNGLYVPHERQYHDHPVTIDHVAPRCSSRQTYHGILDDRAHGVFNGRIVVRHDGIGTDAAQSNKNLILSDRAEIDTRPRLEIFADDVKCAHGATVGQLDENAVFYLRSRGIPEAVARGVLTNAFAAEIVEHVENDTLREWVEQLVSDRLLDAESRA